MAKRKRKRKAGTGRARSLKIGLVLVSFLAILGIAGEWFVHHPRQWVSHQCVSLPKIVSVPLLWFGNPLADITDGLGWTGHDAVYEYDCEAPAGSVSFAGLPKRVGPPAPADITVIDRGEFKIGWSDSLRHPVWCAYHVVRDGRFPVDRRPGFTIDHDISAAPRPDAYQKSGYDRGHMAPNYAIVSRYGEEAQRLTFRMSNISPQSPALNRGVWRDVEHRIAEFWTARYGEIWVVVGCFSKPGERKILADSGVDIPTHFYQIIFAQEGMDVRALALIFPQNVPWSAWAARNIITIRELEELTGLDFNPDLPSFIADPMEADLPSRLWPVRVRDIPAQILLRFRR